MTLLILDVPCPAPNLDVCRPLDGRPYIGMVTIIMNDYPMIKYILVGLMGLFVLTTKE